MSLRLILEKNESMKQSRFVEQTPKKVHRRFATSKRIKL